MISSFLIKNWSISIGFLTASFNQNPIFIVRFESDRFRHSKLKSKFELVRMNQFGMANCLTLGWFKPRQLKKCHPSPRIATHHRGAIDKWHHTFLKIFFRSCVTLKCFLIAVSNPSPGFGYHPSTHPSIHPSFLPSTKQGIF